MYKRQISYYGMKGHIFVIEYMSFSCIGKSFTTLFMKNIHCERRGKIMNETEKRRKELLEQTRKTVSYTHLDVYKRQEILS